MKNVIPTSCTSVFSHFRTLQAIYLILETRVIPTTRGKNDKRKDTELGGSDPKFLAWIRPKWSRGRSRPVCSGCACPRSGCLVPLALSSGKTNHGSNNLGCANFFLI